SVIGVQRLDVGHHQVDRDRDRHDGHEAVAENPEGQVLTAAEGEARKSIGGRCTYCERQECGAGYDDNGVFYVGEEVALEEHRVVVLADDRQVEDVEGGRNLQHIQVGFQRGHQ